jgi:hypothetical protein
MNGHVLAKAKNGKHSQMVERMKPPIMELQKSIHAITFNPPLNLVRHQVKKQVTSQQQNSGMFSIHTSGLPARICLSYFDNIFFK